jgi:hypothetical protein
VVMTTARKSDIPFEDAPRRWAEIATRVDRNEQLRLVRDGDAEPVVLMAAGAFDQAVEDAADLALCREVLAQMPPADPAAIDAEHIEFVAFLMRFAGD